MARIPRRHSENSWEAVDASTLEGNNVDGESSLLNPTSADGVVGQFSLHTRSALIQSSLLSSSIHPISIAKQVLSFLFGCFSIDFDTPPP
jgi:hypothetical protein